LIHLTEEIKNELITKANKIVNDVLRKNAHPWENITENYLSTNEFFRLINVKKTSSRARDIRYFFRVLCAREDGPSLMPAYLKDVFADGIVHVELYKNRGGNVKFEYRVPIKYINDKHLPRAQQLICERTVVTHTHKAYKYRAQQLICEIKESEIISHRTFTKLECISVREGVPIPVLIDQLVTKEFSLLEAER
jgi:hypothetical protein